MCFKNWGIKVTFMKTYLRCRKISMYTTIDFALTTYIINHYNVYTCIYIAMIYDDIWCTCIHTLPCLRTIFYMIWASFETLSLFSFHQSRSPGVLFRLRFLVAVGCITCDSKSCCSPQAAAGAIILSNYRKYYTYNNDIVVADPFFLINILVFLLH